MTDDLRLYCYLLDETQKSCFDVRVKRTEEVSDLRRMIWEEKKKTFEKQNIELNELVLWQISLPDGDNLWERSSELFKYGNVPPVKLYPSSFLSEHWGETPEPRTVHVLVKAPEAEQPPLKRQRMDTGDDIAQAVEDIIDLLQRLQTPSLPPKTVNELKLIVNSPLQDNLKIPVNPRRMKTWVSVDPKDPCSTKDLLRLFREGEENYILDCIFWAVTQQSPPVGGTKNSFHCFWDINIRTILEFLVPGGQSMRNSSFNTATANLRPDYGFLFDEICPFRGEEQPEKSNDDPKAELAEKLDWIYSPAPYVFGYHAKGTKVTLAAITPPPSGSKRPGVVDIVHVDLRLRRERIKNICCLINIARLIQPISHLAASTGGEFKRETRAKCNIEITSRYVIKEYTGPDRKLRFLHTKKVYDFLRTKKVPYTDSLATFFKTSFVLTPRGIPNLKPKNEVQLLDAVTCILKALEVLHETPALFHRDIRWPNIMQSLEEPHIWFLIDWENAAEFPTSALPDFDRSSHSPGIFMDGHGAEVDIWGVGELILQSGILGLSAELRELGQWMKDKGPSAKVCLQRMEEIHQKLASSKAPLEGLAGLLGSDKRRRQGRPKASEQQAMIVKKWRCKCCNQGYASQRGFNDHFHYEAHCPVYQKILRLGPKCAYCEKPIYGFIYESLNRDEINRHAASCEKIINLIEKYGTVSKKYADLI